MVILNNYQSSLYLTYMDKDSINEKLKKLVVTQQCKQLIDNFETELERKKLFNKNYKH